MSNGTPDPKVNSGAYYRAKVALPLAEDRLDQGERMTLLRHRFVAKHLRDARHVLDYGCGEGGMLPLCRDSRMSKYIAADFIPEREEVMQSMVKMYLSGWIEYRFELVHPSTLDFPEIIRALASKHYVDTVVLCGIMGYEGFTGMNAVKEIKQVSSVRKIIVTVPVMTPNYKETLIHRFNMSDVENWPVSERLADGLYGVVL